MKSQSNSDWHWPSFESIICGEMTDRERLGLPDHFVTHRFETRIPDVFTTQCGYSVTRLLEIIADERQELIQRVVAGDILGQRGDPRISFDDPSMIEIPAASTQVGLPREALASTMESIAGLGIDASWLEKEIPRHSVELKAYRIARYPVTNAEYREFLLATKYAEIPSSWTLRRFPVERANHPVHTISDQGAHAYAAWLSTRTGRAFRLPSEAEWEYAAAGPEGREFPWGSDFDADLANTAETGIFTTTAVGIFPGGASYFGVNDMAGNVEEYVADVYRPYPGGSVVTDHLATLHGQYTVARGGSFARFRDLARTRRRHGLNPRSATYAMGFRLAEDHPN